MRNNETGEFELVVGNKQLLSGFFILVLLFAVAFAMGYVVGQNTQHPAKMAGDTPPAGTVVNTAVGNTGDGRPQPSAAPPAAPADAAPATDAGTQPAAGGEAQPPASLPATQPAQAAPAAAPPAEKPAEKPVVKPAVKPASPGIVAASELPQGMYWQVLAVKSEVSEALRQTLKDKGFPVQLTPGTSNLTRVLVGPYADSASYGRAKTALETAGFPPVRYKRD
jgi:cell division septation protein DedD